MPCMQNGFSDPSPGAFRGFCVECETDCDCGVNQYCGTDKDKVKKKNRLTNSSSMYSSPDRSCVAEHTYCTLCWSQVLSFQAKISIFET
jgi:hypothetical protein